jgi:hypothetical protein
METARPRRESGLQVTGWLPQDHPGEARAPQLRCGPSVCGGGEVPGGGGEPGGGS